MSELLQAIYQGDQARADELLAADPELDVFEAAAVGRTDRLGELLDQGPRASRTRGPTTGFSRSASRASSATSMRRACSSSVGRRSTPRRGTT